MTTTINKLTSPPARMVNNKPTMMPGQLHIYHAWERHQFQGKGDMNSVSPVPMNPVEMAGGNGLSPYFGMGQPSFYDRETRVDVERIGGATP